MFSADCEVTEKDRNPMAKLLKDHDGTERRIFLLTRLRNGRVKADRIRTDDDPRLRSKTPFALITVDNIRLTDNETNLEDAARRNLRRVAVLKDEGYLLRPRIARSMGDFGGLFRALRCATEDTVLEVDQTGFSGAEWRVCTKRVGAN